MSRKIFCIFYQCEMTGLNHYIYPEYIGKIIFNQISKEAWKQWLIKQTKLINENNLNMTDKKHFNYLKKSMIYFLFMKN
ncbi:oxidative damage protection protein [Enterobacteriaceae endosymbiont of Plateumaris consimilis]|uniref:oxidative damage protection protein n=1 Tax=Enterobacteriaceae endosymbiont of Plateumaris consimilis TaxID=2675794 RepID=UPI0014490609|nr:oxidative damage protection protein [Enterobacteriaceae endosymbiont of Plateumaris consimilis]QJC28693.1 oxidative damage protection protein [Enterobacteriaceae endosymbiont of Plateumaris consimilis]